MYIKFCGKLWFVPIFWWFVKFHMQNISVIHLPFLLVWKVYFRITDQICVIHTTAHSTSKQRFIAGDCQSRTSFYWKEKTGECYFDGLIYNTKIEDGDILCKDLNCSVVCLYIQFSFCIVCNDSKIVNDHNTIEIQAFPA